MLGHDDVAGKLPEAPTTTRPLNVPYEIGISADRDETPMPDEDDELFETLAEWGSETVELNDVTRFDVAAGFHRWITIELQAGTTYWIQVSGSNGMGGAGAAPHIQGSIWMTDLRSTTGIMWMTPGI